MKSLNPINPARFYELVEVLSGDAYSDDKLGTIITPLASLDVFKHRTSECYRGKATVVVPKGGFKKGATISFFAVILRPLTIKEQEKINAPR